MEKSYSAETGKIIRSMQQNEITEYYIYTNIAKRVKDEKDKAVLLQIAQEELAHSKIWATYTGEELSPNKFKVFRYTAIAFLFGYSFAIKLMEGKEENAGGLYEKLSEEIPAAAQISKDEQRHEAALIEMLDEERLRYIGSMVLGLNDALVELTGTLAGLTFALQNNKLVALSGLITGISATFSMASSEYLSAKSEGRTDALKSCTYTGIAYCITVALLTLPYLILPPHAYGASLAMMLGIVITEIFVFSYYISVAKSLSFKSRFTEMITISLSVAVLSFLIGLVVKRFLGIDV